MTVDIVAVDPLDPTQAELFAGWRAVLEASTRLEYGDDHSVYSADEYRAKFRNQHYERRTAWVAQVGGEVVGHLEVGLPLNDNTHRVDFTLAVHPDHRRKGIGSTLLETLERLAHDKGRTVLGVESDVAAGHDDPAEGFAGRHGYLAAQRDLRSTLTLPIRPDELAAARADAEQHADGYETLTSWDGIPDGWLADRAELSRRMSTDAPLGQIDMNEQEWDGERVRRNVELALEQGRRLVETVARHRATDRLIAFTTMAVSQDNPDAAYQWDTLVLREHRGHRLGLLVKAVNLRALITQLPNVRRIHTWNATENEPMLRVNRALGFAPVGQATEWQKTLTSSGG